MKWYRFSEKFRRLLMERDYRNTKYCPKLERITEKKDVVKKHIQDEHKRAKDMHNFICKNDGSYKEEFMKAYNLKCAYCGASIAFIPKRSFEIDHFLYKESSRFSKKSDAGYIENLVLSCNYCNNKKKDFDIPDGYIDKLHPDKNGISTCFERDKDFYITISDSSRNDAVINAFYKKIEFGSELRRLDYLLLNLIGLKNQLQKVDGMGDVYKKLDAMAELLICRRNTL